MDYKAEKGDTFKSVAMQYTIGGADYAVALARQNAQISAANDSLMEIMVPGVTYIIPDGWLKPIWAGVDQYGKPLSGPMTITIKGAGGSTKKIDLTVPLLIGATLLAISLAPRSSKK